MAEYKFLSEREEDEQNHVYLLEVVSDFGGSEPHRSQHEMVLHPEKAHEKAKQFAEALEAKLKEKTA